MGMYDLPCPVCGTNFGDPLFTQIKNKKALNWLKAHKTQTAWLNELVAIRKNEQPFFGKCDYSGGVEGNGVTIDIDDERSVSAIGMHVACWELLGKPDHKWLKEYSVVSRGDNEYDPLFVPFQDQYFDWESFVAKDKDLWAMIDPRLDTPEGRRNRGRIIALIKDRFAYEVPEGDGEKQPEVEPQEKEEKQPEAEPQEKEEKQPEAEPKKQKPKAPTKKPQPKEKEPEPEPLQEKEDKQPAKAAEPEKKKNRLQLAQEEAAKYGIAPLKGPGVTAAVLEKKIAAAQKKNK